MKKNIKVLYVDDEVQNLNSFKAAFRMDYTVLTTGHIPEIWDILEQHPDISVVLCDQRMPEMTGVEVFEEMRQRYPKPVKMLITGFTDIEAVIEAINRGNIYRYIRKPWQELEVKAAIEQGYQHYNTQNILAAKNEELQKAYNELDKFAYSVSHDLRGPILSVIGVIDLVRSMDSITEIREMLDLVEKAMIKLDNFIENTHDYYKLRRGELEISEISFEELLDDMKAIFEISGRADGVRFETSLEQEGGFRSDKITLLMVLNNLLSNSFKYQKKNEQDKYVRLDIKVKDNKAEFFVSDNGIGINSDYIQNIFDMFYRATTVGIGSGFGLYNVKDALQKLKGEIYVTSELDKGTTFKVTIPGK